jgi:murein DD-endopeptidase MepM/ murein hydrolase activator NlpD
VLELDNGMYAVYGHMYSNQIYVHAGQRVTKGQHIAGVGNAGTSTGAHLHFSLATSFNGSSFNYVNAQNYF